MKTKTYTFAKKVPTALLCLLFLIVPRVLPAEELGTFGDRIFLFQKKLANKGNVLAQYKLGTLYEFGISVQPDTAQATHWYRQAAQKKYVPAINRLTYLDIRENGFNVQQHSRWFEELKSLADSADANALILIGQMHHQGIHVKKDLYKAEKYLSDASSLGHTEVDGEVEKIQGEIKALENAKAKKQAAKKPEKKAKKKQVKKSAKKSTKKSAKQIALEKEKKRRRYEEALRKQQQELLLLEQQQVWTESE